MKLKRTFLNLTSANNTFLFKTAYLKMGFFVYQQVWGISYSLLMPELQLQTASADSMDHVRSTRPPSMESPNLLSLR